jgi:serine/threonine protein kinase
MVVNEYGRLVAGRYRLAERIGAGGMGVVWQAYDERLHRRVAVKRLLMPTELSGPETERARRQAMREGRIAARLQHPNVIGVYDVVAVSGEAYLIMEYLPSTSLSQLIVERGRLPVADVARIGSQVAAGLAAAHAAVVVHRDVKPGNVLLGSDGTAKITDFGISRAVDDITATTTGILAGTPAYLSPEVARGSPANYASDVYSLGATLYAAIEGSPPSGSADNAMALLYRVASADITPPAHAGPLTDLLIRMLDPDPNARPSMSEVRDQLAEPQTEITAPAPPPAPPPTLAPEPRKRLRTAIIAALAVLLLAAAVVTVALTRGRPSGENAARTQPTTSASSSPKASAAPPTSNSPPATATPTQAPPPAPPQDPPTTPAATITAYYALMPGNLPVAWTWLTQKFQQHPAGGYDGYQNYWANVRTVHVSDVNPVSTTQVEATIEYAFKDGRTVRERHRYTLINQNRWKIDESVVLSSRTL